MSWVSWVELTSIAGITWTCTRAPAAIAVAQAAVVSWSAIAITSSRPSAAPSTTASGAHAPSEVVVWMCRSSLTGPP